MNPFDGIRKPTGINGFEQVVNRIDFKSTNRIFTKTRYKNDSWKRIEFFHKRKSIFPSQFNIEENQIGLQVFIQPDGISDTFGFTDDGHILAGSQKAAEMDTGFLMIFDDQSFEHSLIHNL